jgi:tetratricopeptide (TPR) repeat protein
LFAAGNWVNAMLGILGTTALLLDTGPDDRWGPPKERAVLATLAVHAGQVVTVDKLLRWVWPEDSVPDNPAQAYNTYATRLRRALDRLPSPPELRAGQGGYRLELDRSLLDIHRFRSVLTEARKLVEQDPGRVVDMVEGAVWLWRGEPLADLTSEPAQEWRERVLRTDWLSGHTLRIQALIGLGRFDEALAALDEVQADYPEDVTLANLRLSGLYGSRRFSDGVAYFFSTWRRFRDNGDDHAAQHLGQHHTQLATGQTEPITPQATTVPRQLPHDVRDFVGRREQLAALDEACPDTAGVVILEGTGGVGKTTLAVHWAHRVRSRFPDGDLYVDLCGFSDRAAVDPATVVDDLLIALGQPPDPSLPRRQRELLLSSLLAERHTLVLLDNARDTEHIRDLVRLLSSCLVIITSRQRLSTLSAATGARRIWVPAMPTEEATRLLSVHTRGNVPDADKLVDLCGGLPLMITVLAQDLSGRPATQRAQFAARLDRRKLLVAVGDHGDGGPPGEACFTSSYRRLAVPERRLFRLLALHPGPDISAEAASACDGRPPFATTRSLEILVGAHLLEQPNDLDRYRHHDLLGAFAAHRLDLDEPAEEQHAARHRLLDFYIATATEAAHNVYPGYLAPPDQPTKPSTRFADATDAIKWFHRERTNLTAAIHYAHESSSHDHVWRLTDPVATYFDRSGCTIESKALRTLAARSARSIGEREGETSALIGLGLANMDLHELTSARRALEAAMRIAEEIDLERGQAAALHALGRLATQHGDPIEALRFFNRGLVIAEKIDDRHGMSWFHCGIGRALRTIDRHNEAIVHLQQAGWEARRAREKSAESSSLSELGTTCRELGDYAGAVGHSERALAISEAIPDLAASARICINLCEINTKRRHFEESVRYGRRAVETLRGSQNLLSQARAAEALGDALYAAGEPEEAAQAWHQAADRYEYIGAPGPATRVHAKIDSTYVTQERTVPLARADATHRVTVDPPQWLSEPVRHTDG